MNMITLAPLMLYEDAENGWEEVYGGSSRKGTVLSFDYLLKTKEIF